MTLRLRTFGAVYLERDGAPLGGAHSQRRRLALLAYLSASDSAAIAREKLIALLWPESDESSGRHSLSQLLYAIRRDLGTEVLGVDSEVVRLNRALVGSDVRAFDDAHRAGRHEDAVALYLGEFLTDFHVEGAPDFDRWADAERSRLAHACAKSLDKLVVAAEQAGDRHRSAEWLRRRLSLDPADASATLRLMHALAAIGDREGSARVARVYESYVVNELEIAPDSAVLALLKQLQTAPSAPPRTAVPSASAPLTPDPLAAPPTFVRTAPVPAPGSSRRRVVATGLAAVSVIALLGFVARGRMTAGEVARPDAAITRVVIGDLEGPDASLALAIREALRAELMNTPHVLLTSESGIAELKSLMRLSRDSALRPAQLQALATRGGAHLAVSGSVVPVGTGAQIILDLVEPRSGRSLRTFTERPVDGEATLSAVERMARAIGASASRTPLDSAVRPLPAVTTASMAALKSYALARQTAALGKRREAVEPAERAVSHDSGFVLAHYFLGDLLWFIDEQSHSEAHLTKAYDLRSTVPPREQLVIRARYEQLVRDRPDSALAYWQLLADASPGDLLAYEGRTWALRALGRHEEAAAAADTAMSLEPGALLPNITNAMYSWLSVGDTASAIEVAARVAPRYPHALREARFYATLFRDPAAAVPLADSAHLDEIRHWRRHLAQVAAKQAEAARVTLDSILRDDRVQFPPNALIHQGWVELQSGRGRADAAAYARRALDWTRQRDLSPPAIGRLSERIADLAARSGDEATVRATLKLVQDRDRGRALRTYAMARHTIEAALAYVRGDYGRAARLADIARRGVYFSRSLTTIVQLEADARRAAGEVSVADSLSHLVDTHQIVDGHFEAWAVLRALTKKPTS